MDPKLIVFGIKAILRAVQGLDKTPDWNFYLQQDYNSNLYR